LHLIKPAEGILDFPSGYINDRKLRVGQAARVADPALQVGDFSSQRSVFGDEASIGLLEVFL
jgi:hypothetical protein